nr:hypothetical protein Iba_chr11aCG11980 [Ipomoea batatas]
MVQQDILFKIFTAPSSPISASRLLTSASGGSCDCSLHISCSRASTGGGSGQSSISTAYTEEKVFKKIKKRKESLRKVTSILRKMADTVVEFAEVMAETGNTRTRGGFIKKTFENIADMLNVVPFLNLHHRKDYWMMMTFSISKVFLMQSMLLNKHSCRQPRTTQHNLHILQHHNLHTKF